MAIPRIGSPGVGLPYPTLNSNLNSNYVTVAAGTKWLIPAGTYVIDLGPYTILQELDPVSGLWNPSVTPDNGVLASDGVSFRLANITGCAVGALVTTAGTGYLTAPTVTPSIGNSQWRAILGGSLSTTVTLVATGVGYNHPPTVILPPPAPGGIQATATAVVNTSTGLFTGITLTNVGAGYTAAPVGIPSTITALAGNSFGQQFGTYTIIPDPLDTITTPAQFTFGLNTGVATNVTGIICTDPGTAVTSVPTLTIAAAPSGGTTAVATAVMQFTVTGVTITLAGTAYTPSSAFTVIAPGTFVSGTSAVTNPLSDKGLFQPTPTFAYGTTTAAGIVSTAGLVISNGGLHQAVPSLFFQVSGTSVPTAIATGTAQVGGVTDTSIIIRT
jgi:hypothetical protein